MVGKVVMEVGENTIYSSGKRDSIWIVGGPIL